ncbi:hypothetical protein [Mycobacterium sp.]|uniref:hypothetical protein n=1 Tax=Mycobacterium sp. TaxID=1785 RepID=UPI003D10AA39
MGHDFSAATGLSDADALSALRRIRDKFGDVDTPLCYSGRSRPWMGRMTGSPDRVTVELSDDERTFIWQAMYQ